MQPTRYHFALIHVLFVTKWVHSAISDQTGNRQMKDAHYTSMRRAYKNTFINQLLETECLFWAVLCNDTYKRRKEIYVYYMYLFS